MMKSKSGRSSRNLVHEERKSLKTKKRGLTDGDDFFIKQRSFR